MNQEVLKYIRKRISFAPYDWADLSSTQLALNNRDSSVSGVGHFFLEHGYHVHTIFQINIKADIL